MRCSMRYLALLFATILYASETPEETPLSTPEHLATARASREELIGGLISPINGQLVLSPVDLVASSREPLVVRRHYLPTLIPCSLADKEGGREEYALVKHLESGYKGWLLFPHTTLLRYKQGVVRVTEPSGATIDFIVSKGKTYLRSPNWGVSNLSGDTPSGQHDLSNTQITFNDGDKVVEVLSCEGVLRYYNLYHSSSRMAHYLLDKEVLLNGKVVRYYYHNHLLKRVETRDPTEKHLYAAVNLSYSPLQLEATTHTGQKATYGYEEKLVDTQTQQRHTKAKGKFKLPLLLRKAVTPFYQKETLDYTSYYQLSAQEGKEGRFHATYGEDKESSYYRVTGLRLGEEGENHPAYQISYTAPIPGKQAGKTVCKNKDGSFHRYDISKELLVTKVGIFDREGVVKKETLYHWEVGDANRLRFIETKDGNGNLLLKKVFDYDRFGNPIEETVWGDLEGTGGVSGWKVKRVFSLDGRHLLLSEEKEGGLTTTYTYLSSTNLVTKKLTHEGGKILMREFYHYDKSCNLVRKSIDDGSADTEGDLKGVTERKITYYHLKQEHPHLHMPVLIEERYWEGGEEKLLLQKTLDYDQEDRPIKENVHDSQGAFAYTLHKTYDMSGHLLSETDPLGNLTTYSYDERGHVATKELSGLGVIETLEHDPRGRLLHYTSREKNGGLRKVHYRYNASDLVEGEEDHLGNQIRYLYDSISKKAERVEYPPLSRQEVVVESQYNPLGYKIAETNPNGHTTRWRYNGYGSPAEIHYPNGSSERFFYERNGLLKTHLNQDGVQVDYTYDSFGRVIKKSLGDVGEEVFAYNPFHLLSHTNREGETTFYTYDKVGRKIEERFMGKVTSYQYDTLGHLSTISEENGENTRVTRLINDLLGRVVVERKETLSGKLLFEVEYGYDPAGNRNQITRHVNGELASETFLYDGYNRQILHQDSLGHKSATFYTEKKGCFYTTTINPLRECCTLKKDSQGHLLSRVMRDPQGSRIAKEKIIYDPAGNPVETLSYVYQGRELADVQTALHTYSPTNALLSRTLAAGTPYAKTTHYSYTPSGKLKRETFFDGKSLSYAYTPLGKLRTRTSSDSTLHHIFHYNKKGELLQAIDPVNNISVTRKLDPFGNITEESLSTRLALKKTYDKLQRPLTITLPDGSSICYVYDPLFLRAVQRYSATKELLYTHEYPLYDTSGHLLQETLIHNLGNISHTPDLTGRTRAQHSPYSWEENTYDPLGNLESKTTPTGTTFYTYDPLSQLNGDGISSYQFASLHNLEQKNNRRIDLLRNSSHYHFGTGLIENPPLEVEYDLLHRLTSLKREGIHIQFFYDPLSRPLIKMRHTATEIKEELCLYDSQEELATFSPERHPLELRCLGYGGLPISIELREKPFAPLINSDRNIEHLIDPQGNITHSYQFTPFGELLSVDEGVFIPL